LVALPCLTCWLGGVETLAAQNNAAAAAAHEEAEDRYRRLAAQVASLREAQDLHQQQIAALEKSVRDLSDQVARAANKGPDPTQERLTQLAEQIRKVDEARVAENKKIFETIDELHRILKKVAAAPAPRPASSAPPAPAPAPGATANDEGFEYVVQKNDTLSGIVQAYRLQNIKVTAKAIKDANPAVVWERLRVGQKIWIPKPRS
jgi:LysM repeat protein